MGGGGGGCLVRDGEEVGVTPSQLHRVRPEHTSQLGYSGSVHDLK